jgi:hypothetical protein
MRKNPKQIRYRDIVCYMGFGGRAKRFKKILDENFATKIHKLS